MISADGENETNWAGFGFGVRAGGVGGAGVVSGVGACVRGAAVCSSDCGVGSSWSQLRVGAGACAIGCACVVVCDCMWSRFVSKARVSSIWLPTNR